MMTPEELKHWRVSVMKFRNQAAAATALGYSRPRYTEIENGSAGGVIHPSIALACAAIAAGLKPWPEGTEHEELPLETAIRKASGPRKARQSAKKGSAGSRTKATRLQQSAKKKKAAPVKKRPSKRRKAGPGSRGGDRPARTK